MRDIKECLTCKRPLDIERELRHALTASESASVRLDATEPRNPLRAALSAVRGYCSVQCETGSVNRDYQCDVCDTNDQDLEYMFMAIAWFCKPCGEWGPSLPLCRAKGCAREVNVEDYLLRARNPPHNSAASDYIRAALSGIAGYCSVQCENRD